ncbi:hypothetical protein [Bosea sp. BIWAKO-01]|uniref:hypothetical protein n=1 Tax=Bosea sp. BIWAKO-01 TaxID=506668 RepID=UPI000853EBA3|nr:hypothetical protein [Bosea sp. BIWAKO-01]GAU87085.1 hypothetical protein BIWAKO_07038 [Bosea sp. BIWAKO-01]
MDVAQRGVEAFVAQAIIQQVPFAMETVFSYWKEQPDGTFLSKIDKFLELRREGYFVLLCFVGLSNYDLSVGRVQARDAAGGHNIDQADVFVRTEDRTPLEYILKPLKDQIAKAFRER